MAIEAPKVNLGELQRKFQTADHPFEILALTLLHERELDVLTQVCALECVAAHPLVLEAVRDMRLAKLLHDVNHGLHSSRRFFRPRELVRVASAYVRLGVKQPTMLLMVALETAKQIQEFRLGDLASLVLSFAHAGVQDRPMLQAVADELTRGVGDASAKEIGDVAWAFTLHRFRHDTLMVATMDATMQRLRDFPPLALAKVLWFLDTFGRCDLLRPLLAELRDPRWHLEDRREGYRELATALSALQLDAPSPVLKSTFDDEVLAPLTSTLSRVVAGVRVAGSERTWVVSRGSHLGPVHTQRALRPVGVHVTAGRAQAPAWAREAASVLGGIFNEKGPISTFPVSDPKERVTLPIVNKETYAKNMSAFGVDNFGKIGGRCLLNQLGIGRCEENWVAKAKQFVAAWSDGVGKRPDDWKAQTVHRRIYTLAEYHFWSTLRPLAPLLEGTLFQTNGLRSDPELARRPYLAAIPLPISKWVDRTLCAEFQLLTELCEMINRTGVDLASPELRHSVYGVLNLYLSEPSCVSCTGSFKQFVTLFPRVDMYVDCSSSVEPLMARTEIDLRKRKEREEAERAAREAEEQRRWREEHPDWKEGDALPEDAEVAD